MDVSVNSYRSRKSTKSTSKAKPKNPYTNHSHHVKKPYNPYTARTHLNSGGKQQTQKQFIFELQAKLDAQLIKNKEQRSKIKSLRKEKNELKTDLKRAYLNLKKMVSLEQDYQLLLKSFEESENLRN